MYRHEAIVYPKQEAITIDKAISVFGFFNYLQHST